MEWNRVIYADCMNEENGLPSLEDKSIDLCFTDHPWGVEYNKKLIKTTSHFNTGRILKPKKNSIHYNDNFDFEFTIKWVNQINRICKLTFIYTAWKLLPFWYSNFITIKGLGFIYYPNAISRSSISHFNNYDPFIIFGKFTKHYKLHSNVYKTVKKWGFLNNEKWIHPTPKDPLLIQKILKELHSKSVIDPFMGSGTTAEACNKLGIPWLGYEINEVYSQDINKRLKNCRKEPQQITLKL